MFKGTTVEDAAYRWVSTFNAYPRDMISLLMEAEPDDWREVTAPDEGDRVYVLSTGERGEVVKSYGNGKYRVEIEDTDEDVDKAVNVDQEDLEVEYEDLLPMWRKIWGFGDDSDEDWLEKEDGIRVMSECGFRIFHHDEWGYFFGIDGAGYNFYEAHWIPLYKARGLHWHDPATEKEE